jgi:hypothetical protein
MVTVSTAELVAEMAEDCATQRSRHKPDGVRTEGGQGARQRIQRRKEQLVENQGSRSAIDQKVIPLNDRAKNARPYNGSKSRVLRIRGQLFNRWSHRHWSSPHPV